MIRLSEKGQVYALFALVTLTCAMGSLTQTAMNSMLGGVNADFGVDSSLSQWLTTAYMLVIGITVPVVTFLSQRTSSRNLLLLALGFFGAGSLVGFWAPNFALLLVGRVLQAVATGISLPFVQAIAMMRFPPGQNATAMGIAGIAMGFAPNIGPTIGGALVDTWGWRSFFAIMLVATVLFMVATLVLVAREEQPARGASLDVPSLLLSTLGFGGLLMACSNAASMSVTSALVWLPVLVGALALALFVRRQRRIANPLISMRIFQSARYRASFVAQNLLFGSFMGITLIVPLYVQGLLGGTALEAGMVFIPATIGALIFNPVAGILCDRIGSRKVVVAASTLLFAGALSMAFVNEGTPLWLLTALQTVRAVGVSSLIGPLASWGMAGLPREVMMDGSAFFATVRQACASLGTAVMVLVITALAGMAAAGAVPAALGYQLAFGFSALLAAGVLVIAVWKIR